MGHWEIVIACLFNISIIRSCFLVNTPVENQKYTCMQIRNEDNDLLQVFFI